MTEIKESIILIKNLLETFTPTELRLIEDAVLHLRVKKQDELLKQLLNG